METFDGAEAEIVANVTMWEPVGPLERAERYEEPLAAALEAAGVGTAGDGGGTLMSKEHEIVQIDFDVTLTSAEGLAVVTRVLEAAGAPRGSVLRYTLEGAEKEVSFGVAEGLAIYLDGVGLPSEVYEATDVEELVALLRAAAPTAQLRGSWQGPTETALYLFAPDAEALWATLAPVLRGYPLSRNARVVVRYGNPALQPREVRLGLN